MLYFENGVQQYPYPGDNNKAAIISFLKDPKPEVAKKAPEKEWKDEPSEVVHLTGNEKLYFTFKIEFTNLSWCLPLPCLDSCSLRTYLSAAEN